MKFTFQSWGKTPDIDETNKILYNVEINGRFSFYSSRKKRNYQMMFVDMVAAKATTWEIINYLDIVTQKV